MANPIRRMLEIVFDRASGKKAEAEVKESLSGMESGISKLSEMAKKLGAILAAAFGVRAIINFGKEAIRAAMDSEKALSLLKGTINSVGADYEKLAGRIKAAREIFEAGTKYDDDAFNESLARMTVLTGDVEASLNNMGLVANVAARFFGGELAPAVELVSKVMNGNIAMLGRMGIHVKSAQEGLDVLANRSMNGAAEEAKTFSGQLANLNKKWDDFKKAIGFALIDAANGESILQRLTSALVGMIRWVEDNREALSDWGRLGISTVELVGGSLTLAFGAFTGAVILLTEGLLELVKVFNLLPGAAAKLLTGKDPLGEYLDGAIERAERLLGMSNKLIEMGAGAIGAAFGSGLGSGVTIPPMPGKRPMVGKNAPKVYDPNLLARADDALSGYSPQTAPTDFLGDKTLELYQKQVDALTHVRAMAELLGPSFDKAGAEAELWRRYLEDLTQAEIDAGREAEKLGKTAEKIDPTALRAIAEEANRAEAASALKTLARDLDDVRVAASFASPFDDAGNRIDSVTTKMGELRSEAESLTQALVVLAKTVGRNDPEYLRMATRLRAIQKEMAETTKAITTQAAVAGAVGEALDAALTAGLGPFAAQKAKQNALLAVEEKVEAMLSVLNPLTAGRAPVLLAAASTHLALAAGWGALAAVSGGFSGGAGSASGAGAAAGISGGAASKAETPQQEVNIYLVGPGFDATNPEVQKVVYGAQQQARERYGDNAKVRIIRKAS